MPFGIRQADDPTTGGLRLDFCPYRYSGNRALRSMTRSQRQENERRAVQQNYKAIANQPQAQVGSAAPCHSQLQVAVRASSCGGNNSCEPTSIIGMKKIAL